jgi:hypothetical protein
VPIKKGTPAYARQLERQRVQYQEEKIRKQATANVAALDRARTVAPVDPLRWRADPIGWAQVRLGVDPRTLRWSLYGGPYDTHVWDGDVDPLAKAADALAAGQWVGVESGKGTGKTYLAAILVLWFLENWVGPSIEYDPTVVTMAAQAKQLQTGVWKHIGRFLPQFKAQHPAAQLQNSRLRMRREDDPQSDRSWNAWARSAGAGAGEASASRAQGEHDINQLYILEETAGIKQAIVTAVEETQVVEGTNLILAIGNPHDQFDPLHQFCVSPGVVHIRISALDHPNVVLNDATLMYGATTASKIERLRAKHGEDSPRFNAAVRGLSPAEAEDALIKLSWLKEAATRDVAAGAPALGFDPSNSQHGDPAGLARGLGARLVSVEAFRCPDALVAARDRVAPLIASGLVSASAVGVDGIGVGASAVSKLNELGYRVVNIQSSATPVPRKGEVEQYDNLRAQMYDTLADDLQYGRVGGPGFADLELQRELTATKSGARNGKTYIQEKDKIRAKLGRSPNKADAVVYWNWVRQSGGTTRTTWGFHGQW